ncbi:hypothetical protein C2G38_1790746 [Gigaspora rosea]|uniref:Uncharacterized protein n=1 Tax=Gigaspora rosea TaxID=44941 RepID=A0A397USY3_9GLOM|nr:hypothetical protein C2G38_1790746 [Gigaspora rosea]
MLITIGYFFFFFFFLLTTYSHNTLIFTFLSSSLSNLTLIYIFVKFFNVPNVYFLMNIFSFKVNLCSITNDRISSLSVNSSYP